MKIYYAVIRVRTKAGYFATHKCYVDMNTLEDFVDLLRSHFAAEIGDVKVNCEFVGSVDDVD